MYKRQLYNWMNSDIVFYLDVYEAKAAHRETQLDRLEASASGGDFKSIEKLYDLPDLEIPSQDDTTFGNKLKSLFGDGK